jgi:glycosyltransferase involved in cell wall biosynthesis
MMKVAIVHDWLVSGGGGAERVVYELHKMYPKAPIYTSYCSPEWREKLAGTQVITSYMQHWPFSKLRKFLPPLRAVWFSRRKFDEFDLVISSSGAEAKGIKVKKPTIHINYCHAPTHYYWSRYDDYLQNPGFGKFDWLARLGLKLLLGPMRKWDYKAAQRPDYIIANSSYIKDQIKKYYGRESEVVHPPVDIDRFSSSVDEPRRGFIAVGRQTPYKRIDLAVAACTELNLPLVVLGSGPEHSKLKRMAGKSVTFFRGKSDEEVAHYFQTSLAFIFPGIDDFGIVGIEALAAGTPVIAYDQGGSLDYVNSKTGILFNDQTKESLINALKQFEQKKFSESDIKAQAKKFSTEEFSKNIASLIKEYLTS